LIGHGKLSQEDVITLAFVIRSCDIVTECIDPFKILGSTSWLEEVKSTNYSYAKWNFHVAKNCGTHILGEGTPISSYDLRQRNWSFLSQMSTPRANPVSDAQPSQIENDTPTLNWEPKVLNIKGLCLWEVSNDMSHTSSLALILGHSREFQIRFWDQQRHLASICSMDGSGESTTRNASSNLQTLPIHHETQQFVEWKDSKKSQGTPSTLWQIQGMAMCKSLERLWRWIC